MKRLLFTLILLLSNRSIGFAAPPVKPIATDLLIVGGTESGWAAAIQAARTGVKSITLVHDGEWLGGQYTEQSLACVDENKGMGKVGWGVDWHPMKRSFHRFGLFKELMDRIEAFNEEKYGSPMPGRPYHGPSTFRPAEAQAVFRQMLQPYIDSGQVRFITNHYPVTAFKSEDGKSLMGVGFRRMESSVTPPLHVNRKVPSPHPSPPVGERVPDLSAEAQRAKVEGRVRGIPGSAERIANRDSRKFSPKRGEGEKRAVDFVVRARITIDASDFGDVIQVAGAAFEVGPDPQSRYGEPSAPKDLKDFPANEMNPITWAMIVEEADDWSPIPKPVNFDDRNYPRATHLSRAEFGSLKWDQPARVGAIAHWPDAGKVSPRQLSVYTVRRIVDGTTSKDGRTSILLNYMNGQDYALERLPKRVCDALEATEPGASMKNYVLMTREQRQIIFEDARQHSLGVLYHLQNFVHERAPDKTHSFRKFRLSREFGTPDNLPPKPYIRESLRLKAMYMMREQDGRNFDGKDKKSAREAFANVMYPDGLFSWQFHYDFHRTGRTYLKDEGENGPWIDYEKPGRHTRFVSDRSVFPLRSLIPIEMDGLLGAQRNIGNSSIVSAAIRLHDQGVHVGQAAGAAAAVCLRDHVQPREVPFDRPRLERVREALCGGTTGAPTLLWPFRDLSAEHPAFVAINRLAALGALPLERRKVDFKPDEPATMEWRAAVVQTSLRDRVVKEAPGAPQGEMTRGEFAIQWWAQIEDLPHVPFVRMKRGDADDDGIPDSDDALPFNADNRSWPDESSQANARKLTPEFDGIPADLKSDLPAVRRINFTGKGSGKIAEFENDHGLKFDADRGFGWTRDISGSNRRRRALKEAYRDTFLFTRTSDTWECSVTNGKWNITVCVGDSGHEQPAQFVFIEGRPVLENVDTEAGQFVERSVTIEVKDGRLTVRIGRDQPGSNTCLNWLTIAPALR